MSDLLFGELQLVYGIRRREKAGTMKGLKAGREDKRLGFLESPSWVSGKSTEGRGSLRKVTFLVPLSL